MIVCIVTEDWEMLNSNFIKTGEIYKMDGGDGSYIIFKPIRELHANFWECEVLLNQDYIWAADIRKGDGLSLYLGTTNTGIKKLSNEEVIIEML